MTRPEASRHPRRDAGQRSGEDGPVKVVVADDQRVVRDGLVTILGAMAGIEVVGTAQDGAEAVSLAEQASPHVVLMDLRMPGTDGIEATTLILASRPGTAVAMRLIVGLAGYLRDEAVRWGGGAAARRQRRVRRR